MENSESQPQTAPPAPAAEPARQPRPEKKKRRKLWLILLIAAALLAAAAVIWELGDEYWLPGAEPNPAAAPEQAAPAVSDAAAEPQTPSPPAVEAAPTVQPAMPVPADKSEWIGFADPTTGFQIIYPPADPEASSNPATGVIDLAPATGEKERTLRIEILSKKDPRADENGCVDRLPASTEPARETVNGLDFCLVTRDEGAAGSTYRSYVYSTVHEDRDLAVFTFTVRFPTSVRIYAGCEEDADQSKTFCVEKAFDETRDAALFREILGTLIHLQN